MVQAKRKSIKHVCPSDHNDVKEVVNPQQDQSLNGINESGAAVLSCTIIVPYFIYLFFKTKFDSNQNRSPLVCYSK